MKLTEICSCTASFTIETVSAAHEWMIEQAAKWRAEHHHEMPEAEPEQPLIHESGSSHERAIEDAWPDESRARIGFRMND
jgi:hypothetical protein